ncbi:MAG: prolyl oligopeptidase family serine peptidase [Candidatus Latescibacterota bacterium]|nr:prolyl oligopeptidase family serine peptidase [Candidatus Latescibacterota bacterium]
MKALQPDLKLSGARERDIDPEIDLVRVMHIFELTNGTIVCALSACLPDTDTRVFRVAASGDLEPVSGLKEIDKIWPADDALMVMGDGGIDLVSLKGDRRRLVDLPDGVSSIDASWLDGARIGAIQKGDRLDGPELFPFERERDRLLSYTPQTGWVEVADIPSGCRSLSISGDGSRCSWVEPLNTIPEEAMRGEYRACDIETGEVIKLTEGAGQALAIQIAKDGSGTLYLANFQREKPITTNTDLWWHPRGIETPTKLTTGNRSIDRFGWLNDETVWVCFIDGLNRVTETIALDGTVNPIAVPVSSGGVVTADGLVAELSDSDNLPFLCVDDKAVEIPQPDDFTDLQVRTIDWEATDGLAIHGVIYEAKNTPDGAPLLVRAHGGPAGDVEANLGGAVRHRHLIRGGYRVFEPAFRGSLGFGDDFLGANIGCQGVKDLDDIVTGVDKLVNVGVADTNRVGIFGGSYGGYMTFRAVAVTDRFVTGVSLYGFIDNRWMTLETGDFTYENEYIAPVTWPMKDTAAKSDVFSHLHEINCPLLMLHGDEDPVCALSQSKIVYRALEHRGIQTGLVVYPGEGHGFRKPEHRQDCARRTLAWFNEFLPVKDGNNEAAEVKG